MARLITSCWICSVPSKMSWFTLPRCIRPAPIAHAPASPIQSGARQ